MYYVWHCITYSLHECEKVTATVRKTDILLYSNDGKVRKKSPRSFGAFKMYIYNDHQRKRNLCDAL